MHCPNCGNDIAAQLSGRNCCTCACDQCGCTCTIIDANDQTGERSVAGNLADAEPNNENAGSTKTKIIISVHGGLVQDVFCSESEADVTIVDWDVESYSEVDDGFVRVPDTSGKESPAVVMTSLAESLRAISGTPIQLALERAGVPCCGARPSCDESDRARMAGRPAGGDDARCNCEHPGYFCSGVPGIIARVENGRLAQGASVERCDACERYPSDEAALTKLRELGLM